MRQLPNHVRGLERIRPWVQYGTRLPLVAGYRQSTSAGQTLSKPSVAISRMTPETLPGCLSDSIS